MRRFRQGGLAAVAAMAMALGVQAAFGQGAPAPGQWTVQNVDRAKPFGDIKVDVSKASEQSLQALEATLSPAQKAELMGRCSVISAAANVGRYSVAEFAWCNSYMGLHKNDPGFGAR